MEFFIFIILLVFMFDMAKFRKQNTQSLSRIKNNTEYEVKGIVRPITIHSFYIRIWIGNAVLILDSKEGIKKTKKNRQAVKLLFGIKSHE